MTQTAESLLPLPASSKVCRLAVNQPTVRGRLIGYRVGRSTPRGSYAVDDDSASPSGSTVTPHGSRDVPRVANMILRGRKPLTCGPHGWPQPPPRSGQTGGPTALHAQTAAPAHSGTRLRRASRPQPR
jgi:hypothetical protein